MSPPEDLPDLGTEPASPVSPALWEASVHTEALGKPLCYRHDLNRGGLKNE